MNIDANNYPIVRMQNDPSLDMGVEEVLASFSKLLLLGRPFAFIGEGTPEDEGGNGDDRRQVTLWMKANKAELRRLVKGHVQIVPDASKRAEMEAFSVVFGKFWGYPMFIATSEEEAQGKARSLLAET